MLPLSLQLQTCTQSQTLNPSACIASCSPPINCSRLTMSTYDISTNFYDVTDNLLQHLRPIQHLINSTVAALFSRILATLTPQSSVPAAWPPTTCQPVRNSQPWSKSTLVTNVRLLDHNYFITSSCNLPQHTLPRVLLLIWCLLQLQLDLRSN